MPDSVRQQFNTLITGQDSVQVIADLATGLLCETPVNELELILTVLLQSYHDMHQAPHFGGYGAKVAAEPAAADVAREFPDESSTNEVPHWDNPTEPQEI